MASYEEFQPHVNGEGSTTDPDPFAIGIAIFTILVGGGAWLEARRQRQFLEQQHLRRFRATWYEAQRALIHARRVVDEFATYVKEDAYGDEAFLFGEVTLTLDPGRFLRFQRIYRNALKTATVMGVNLHELSEFVSTQYQPLIEQIREKLKEQGLPHSYDALLILAREALSLFESLISEIGKNEQFA